MTTLTLLLFLASSVSLTWQQDNPFWSFPYNRRFLTAQHPALLSRYANYYGDIDLSMAERSAPSTGPQSYTDYLPSESQIGRQLDVASTSNPAQLGSFVSQRRQASEPRAFGFLGYNYLANIILNSLALASTKISYTTLTSTITAGTVVNCYSKALFKATLPCRRRRTTEPLDELLIGPDAEVYHSTNLEKERATMSELPREGRDVDPADFLLSSQPVSTDGFFDGRREEQQQRNELSIERYIRQNRQEFNGVTVTSTVTTYSVYISTSTRTFSTNLAADSALLCIPSGFVIC